MQELVDRNYGGFGDWEHLDYDYVGAMTHEHNHKVDAWNLSAEADHAMIMASRMVYVVDYGYEHLKNK